MPGHVGRRQRRLLGVDDLGEGGQRHADADAVLGQDLLRRHLERLRAQIDLGDLHRAADLPEGVPAGRQALLAARRRPSAGPPRAPRPPPNTMTEPRCAPGRACRGGAWQRAARSRCRSARRRPGSASSRRRAWCWAARDAWARRRRRRWRPRVGPACTISKFCSATGRASSAEAAPAPARSRRARPSRPRR